MSEGDADGVDQGFPDGSVPNVVGLEVGEAYQTLFSMGYSVRAEPDWWADPPAGVVTGSRPRPGSWLDLGSLVEIFVADPQPPPDLSTGITRPEFLSE